MKKILLLSSVIINSCFAAYNCDLVLLNSPKGSSKKSKNFTKNFVLYAHSIDQASTYIPDEDFKLISKESPELESMSLYFETKENDFRGYINFPFKKELTKINYGSNLAQGGNGSNIQLNCTKI